MRRIIDVPSSRLDEPGATLIVESANGETATMTLALAGTPLAVGDGFGRAQASTRTWLDCAEHEVATTFAAFLAHALESRQPDARDAWTIHDDDAAADWLDALDALGEDA